MAGSTTSYTLTATNTGPGTADNALLKDLPVPGLVCSSVACSGAFSGASCPAAGSTTVANLQGAGIAVPVFPPGSSVTFALTCGVTATGQ